MTSGACWGLRSRSETSSGSEHIGLVSVAPLWPQTRAGRRHKARASIRSSGRQCPSGDRMSPMSTSGLLKTLAFHQSALGKVGQDARAFRRASRSGVPLPARWTFASALLASDHCLDAALRPPGFACFQSSLVGRGTPDLVDKDTKGKAGSGSDRIRSTVAAALFVPLIHRLPPEASSFRANAAAFHPARRSDANGVWHGRCGSFRSA